MSARATTVTVVVGSHRAVSASGCLAARIAALLRQAGDTEVLVLDLGREPLPLWADDFGRRESAVWDAWVPVSEVLARSDAFVFVVPEWGGMAPPAVKNLFLLCDGTTELADKPAVLVGVSAGRGGAYPLAELRMSSYKNTRICYIPEQVVVRDVDSLFEGDGFVETPEAKRLERQLLHALGLLLRYADALALVRASDARDFDEFPWGM